MPCSPKQAAGPRSVFASRAEGEAYSDEVRCPRGRRLSDAYTFSQPPNHESDGSDAQEAQRRRFGDDGQEHRITRDQTIGRGVLRAGRPSRDRIMWAGDRSDSHSKPDILTTEFG